MFDHDEADNVEGSSADCFIDDKDPSWRSSNE